MDKPYYDRMHQRLQSSYAKRMKKLRSSTAEPVLGTLVNFLSMRRVNTRGLKSANKCMLMAAVAYNLKKLLRFTAPKVTAMVKKLETKKKKGTGNIFSMLQALMMYNRIKNHTLNIPPYSHP